MPKSPKIIEIGGIYRENKKNYVQCAPVDLAALSKYKLAVFVCGLKRNALRVVLDELEALEADERKEVQ